MISRPPRVVWLSPRIRFVSSPRSSRNASMIRRNRPRRRDVLSTQNPIPMNIMKSAATRLVRNRAVAT